MNRSNPEWDGDVQPLTLSAAGFTDATVFFDVIDNDVQAIVASPSIITVGEGAVGVFTVALARPPTAPRDVTLRSGDLDAVRRKKRVAQVRRVVGEKLEAELWGPRGNTEQADSLLAKSITPYDVAEEILGAILGTPTTTRGTS